MFKKLVILILQSAGYNQSTAAAALGYAGQSSLLSLINKKSIQLATLAEICKLCNYDIIVTNNKGINISILQYIEENKPAQE